MSRSERIANRSEFIASSASMEFDRQSLEAWQRDQPLSVLQLDPADRAVLRIADERDAIQKKTFTKWVNKHLKKAGRNVRDLFEDLRDGHNLLSLLEVLSGEILPRERGRMRFHAIQNVETALRFLRYKEIKLVNIRGEDIVDGNPKLTLGLIWTIILHFQISDIVVGQEDLTAKEALLRWAQKTTQKYPGVKVTDFTQSWRDGLAFNAIIHRNRPDLVDWRQVEKRQVRERIDLAFHVMDREYGVTRLLDPEDVDTPEPDEKSIITYVSQLYDVFPEPPPGHPLFDAEATKKMEMLRDLASSLHQWIREHITIMQDRNFPNNLNEMKQLAEDSNRFRVQDLPPRLKEKEKLFSVFRELERQMKDANFEMDRELYPENIERSWSHLMMLYQERDQLIQEEIVRLEKLQRLAEKIQQEVKMTDSKLDDIEAWIEDEAKRIDHLHPKDAKNNCDQIERELSMSEEVIKSMFSDVQILRDNRFHQAQDLHRRVQQVHEKWVNIRTLLQTKLINILNIHTNPDFKFLAECTEWVAQKLKQLKEGEYGSDMQTVKLEYDRHQKEHKVIDQFQGNVEKCREAEVKFHGEELKIYGERMTVLQKAYNELLVLSNKRVSDLHSLHDFMAAAHAELSWLNEREDREAGRDWSDKNLRINEVEQYYEKLMSELEKRETQFSSVLDRGESLIISHHPASQVIEAHMAAMQGKWAWLLQLTLCLETHLKYTSTSQRFFQECSVAEEWMTTKEPVRPLGEYLA
jgi:dystonin